MATIFTIDKRDLKKFQRYMKDCPKLIKPVTANILNSLAFTTRKYDIENITRSMTVRNPRFVQSSLIVVKSPRVEIHKQVAYAGSINRPRFTGWKEQQEGTPSKKTRTWTLYARGGSKQSQVKQKYRLRASNKFYKPSEFSGRNLKSSFMFMMRVLGSRGGGEFILDQDMPTQRGVLRRGAYSFRQNRIKKIQDFTKSPSSRRIAWRTQSLASLRVRNDMKQIWARSMTEILKRYK